MSNSGSSTGVPNAPTVVAPLTLTGSNFANLLTIAPGASPGIPKGSFGNTINNADAIGISASQEIVLQTGITGAVNNGVNGASFVTIVSADLSVHTAGKGLRVNEGANGKQGIATLVAGTVTVANTSVTANSRIFFSAQEGGTLTGIVRVSARVVGTSFTLTSTVGTDTAVIAWEIFEPG